MIAMRYTSLRARAKRAYGDFVETTKHGQYRRGFRHAMTVVAVVLAVFISIPIGMMITTQQTRSASASIDHSIQYYLLNDDGTIKDAVDKEPSGQYFQDGGLFNSNVPLGRTVTTYTSPDGIEHEISLKIMGTMNVEDRIKWYNQLVQSGEMKPVEAGSKLASLTEYLQQQWSKLGHEWPSMTVEPIIQPIGQQVIIVGSDDLLQSFREGVSPEQYAPSNGGTTDWMFACQEINLSVGNGNQYLNALKERYAVFSTVDYTMSVNKVLSKTAEPCDLAYGPPSSPGMQVPPSYEEYETHNGIESDTNSYSKDGVYHSEF